MEEVEIIFDLLEELLLSSILSTGPFADIDSFGLVVVKLQDNVNNFAAHFIRMCALDDGVGGLHPVGIVDVFSHL